MIDKIMKKDDVEGENSQTNLWWLGAIIYLSGSILINLGSNLIRYSHERLKNLSPENQPPIYKRYWWLAGFGIFGVGNILNFVGFMFAAQSLLVGLGSIQFVSNLLFAHFVNSEAITTKGLVATGIIIGGNVMIVIFGSKTSVTYDIYQLYELLIAPSYLIYISIIIFLVFVLQTSYLFIKFKIIPKGDTHPFLLKYMPLAYAGVSAMIGTWSVTLGKALSGIVLQSIDRSETGQLKTVWPYLILLAFIAITIFWLYRMNSALRNYDAMFIIPVLQALWLLFGVLGGGIFFEEFDSLSASDLIFFSIGVFILLIGVSILSPKVTSGGVEALEEIDRKVSDQVVVVYTNTMIDTKDREKTPLI